LRRVEDSRLLLRWRGAYAEPSLRQSLHGYFAAQGISPERIELRGDCGAEHPLAVYHDVDITLDPHPYSGSTVTFESLWMGVPVVTWPADAMVGRWSAALLGHLGLEPLIAAGPDDYVDRAAALAASAEWRSRLRTTLRQRVMASSLCDGAAKTRQVERLYRAFWRRWCKARNV
ncbi:MAG: glycosyltransferase, partial [Magnetospirillum sp.]|nr:glycosyltransferase [Magnetospirillum sp.]